MTANESGDTLRLSLSFLPGVPQPSTPVLMLESDHSSRSA